jgi:hypothetical protein
LSFFLFSLGDCGGEKEAISDERAMNMHHVTIQCYQLPYSIVKGTLDALEALSH